MSLGPTEKPRFASNQYSTEPPSKRFPRLYPMVKSIIEPHLMAAGTFIGSQPQGVTIHTAADDDLKRTIRGLIERKLGYHLIVDRDGLVHQTAYLDKKVNHAGPSTWQGLSCNSWHASICLLGWGNIDKDGKAWNGKLIPEAERVKREGNVGKGVHLWQASTTKQEETLWQLLRWFAALGVNPNNITGHDEAAIPPGRKVDPGGALSFKLETARRLLCAEFKVKYKTDLQSTEP